MPDYAQFDNGTVFQGPHQYPDAVGSATRMCLLLGVVPVFALPRVRQGSRQPSRPSTDAGRARSGHGFTTKLWRPYANVRAGTSQRTDNTMAGPCSCAAPTTEVR